MTRPIKERVQIPCAGRDCAAVVPVLPRRVDDRKHWYCERCKPQRGSVTVACSTENCDNTLVRPLSRTGQRPICAECLERGAPKRERRGSVVQCVAEGCSETFYRQPSSTKRYCRDHARLGIPGRPASPGKKLSLPCSVEGCTETVERWASQVSKRKTSRVVCPGCRAQGAGMRERNGEVVVCARPECSETFYRSSSNPTQRFHSVACRNQAARDQWPTFSCDHCGDKFAVAPSLASCNANRFCCKEHEFAFRRQAALGRVSRTSDGYLAVFEPDHPNAQPSTGNVMQHIKVVADALGRPLGSGENVHHKNGNGEDNRLTNLELWVTKQPSGQTPADLVAYAYEILDRYATEVEAHPDIMGVT